LSVRRNPFFHFFGMRRATNGDECLHVELVRVKQKSNKRLLIVGVAANVADYRDSRLSCKQIDWLCRSHLNLSGRNAG